MIVESFSEVQNGIHRFDTVQRVNRAVAHVRAILASRRLTSTLKQRILLNVLSIQLWLESRPLLSEINLELDELRKWEVLAGLQEQSVLRISSIKPQKVDRIFEDTLCQCGRCFQTGGLVGGQMADAQKEEQRVSDLALVRPRDSKQFVVSIQPLVNQILEKQ